MKRGFPIQSTKAQAALEFLTTYGWAILVILITVSALAYFGILSPKNILPDRCLFTSGIECQDYQMLVSSSGDDTFNLRLKNALGKTINVGSGDFNVTGEGNLDAGCTHAAVTNWAEGAVQTFSFSNCNLDGTLGFASGSKEKLYISFKYNQSASGGFKHVAEGEIFGTVQ